MEKTTKKQRKLNSLNKKENNLKEKISKILVKYKVSKIDYEDMETLINSLIENEINKGNLWNGQNSMGYFLPNIGSKDYPVEAGEISVILFFGEYKTISH